MSFPGDRNITLGFGARVGSLDLTDQEFRQGGPEMLSKVLPREW